MRDCSAMRILGPFGKARRTLSHSMCRTRCVAGDLTRRRASSVQDLERRVACRCIPRPSDPGAVRRNAQPRLRAGGGRRSEEIRGEAGRIGTLSFNSAIGMAHEAATCGTPHRLLPARMVLTHRLQPRDPLELTPCLGAKSIPSRSWSSSITMVGVRSARPVGTVTPAKNEAARFGSGSVRSACTVRDRSLDRRFIKASIPASRQTPWLSCSTG